MDAIKSLENDHRKVEQLFKQVEGADDDKRKLQIFDQIKLELLVHAEIEEQLFYPACRQFEQLSEQLDEAYEEHAQARNLILEIDELREEALRLDAKISVLKEDIQHHVEEEEGQLFPQVRKLFDARQLEALGDRMDQLKQELMKNGLQLEARMREGSKATGEAGSTRGGSSGKRSGASGKQDAHDNTRKAASAKGGKSTPAQGKKAGSTTAKKSGSTQAKGKQSGQKSGARGGGAH